MFGGQVIKNAKGEIVNTTRDSGGGTVSIYDGRGNFLGFVVKR
jgi:hypothetical protein